MAVETYPASLDIEYPANLSRVKTFFRIFLAIPIVIILFLLDGSGGSSTNSQNGTHAMASSGGISGGLFIATALMILFRQVYPRWWFDFALELNRFSTRVGAYLFLLTDRYPSTVDKQTVTLNITYPDAKQDLNRWLPLVKWFLAIPHYIVLFLLIIAACVVTVIAWFAILVTGRYPKGLFDFMVGVGRYGIRVAAYSFLLTTDKYPPFSLS